MPCFFNCESHIDQADMCERLREISECFSGPGVYFFGKQANVVGKRQEMIDASVLLMSSHVFESPKAADPKCPFVATQSINTGFVGCSRRHAKNGNADR